MLNVLKLEELHATENVILKRNVMMGLMYCIIHCSLIKRLNGLNFRIHNNDSVVSFLTRSSKG